MLLPCAAPLAKHAVRRAPRAGPSPRFPALSPRRAYSTPTRPYRFHVAAGWAGKPYDPRGPRVKTAPFPAESAIGRWRDATLARPNVPGVGAHIGEDFFYIQDVSSFFIRLVRRVGVSARRCLLTGVCLS